MANTISLDRKKFFHLHQAIVLKCDDLLRKGGKKQLSRINQQHFYGYQAGADQARSINKVVQDYLEEHSYKNLDQFRNYKLNGRRLNDLVGIFNSEEEEIEMKKTYYDAYLFFLGEELEILSNTTLSVPSKISLRLGDPPITSEPNRILKWIYFVTALIVLGILYAYLRPIFVPPEPSIQETSGGINKPDNHSILSRDFKCSGTLSNLPEDWHVWLFVERDTLINGNTVIRYWPKEPKIPNDSLWEVSLQENYDSSRNYSENFSISMYALNKENNEKIELWFKKSSEEGEYLPLKAVPWPRKQFNRIFGLKIIKEK